MRLVTLVLLALATLAPAHAAPNGERLFAEHCAACHGYDGKGGVGVPLSLPDFLAAVDDRYLATTIRLGRPGRIMPAFSSLSDAQIGAIVKYIRGWMPDGLEVTVPQRKVKGDAVHGKQLFAQYCAACHGADGTGGHGTGVTFSRPRDLPIIPPGLNNSGYLAAASNEVIKATLLRGREGTPMVSFLKQGLSEQAIDDIVTYIRTFAPKVPKVDADEPASISFESSYSLEETVENIKRAAVGKNFRIIRVQTLDQGLVPAGEENPRQTIIYFCNFNFINKILALDPRLGMFMPCRVTVVERDGVVSVTTLNPKFMSRFLNNGELNQACDEMKTVYTSILEEATL